MPGKMPALHKRQIRTLQRGKEYCYAVELIPQGTAMRACPKRIRLHGIEDVTIFQEGVAIFTDWLIPGTVFDDYHQTINTLAAGKKAFDKWVPKIFPQNPTSNAIANLLRGNSGFAAANEQLGDQDTNLFWDFDRAALKSFYQNGGAPMLDGHMVFMGDHIPGTSQRVNNSNGCRYRTMFERTLSGVYDPSWHNYIVCMITIPETADDSDFEEATMFPSGQTWQELQSFLRPHTNAHFEELRDQAFFGDWIRWAINNFIDDGERRLTTPGSPFDAGSNPFLDGGDRMDKQVDMQIEAKLTPMFDVVTVGMDYSPLASV